MRTRSDRVVVGYDGSPPAAIAVEWAAGEADRRGVSLTVFHAADYAVVLPGRLPTRPNPFEAAAMGVSDEGVELARKAAPGVRVEGETHVARVVPALIQASQDAALLVVGSRGHGELTAALLGSVAFAATAHAECPVVVVRAGTAATPGPDNPVVVGVDGWPGSSSSLAFAAEMASRASAPLVVLCAFRSVHSESSTSAMYWAIEAAGAVQFERHARQLAVEASDAAAARARALYVGLDVRPTVTEGRVPQVLVEASRDAGLLVVGARGDGGFAGLRLGSVTHAVLHDAQCPVAVIRREGDDDVERAAEREVSP